MIMDLGVMMAVIYGLYCCICGAAPETRAVVEEPNYDKRDLDP